MPSPAADVIVTSSMTELDQATKFYTAGKIEEALKAIDAVLQKKPRDVSAHYLRANCLLKQKHLPQAAHEYAIVVHLAPKSAVAEHARKAGAEIAAVQRTQAAKQSGASSTKHLPPGTIELIRLQAAQARKRAIDTGEAEADAELKKAESQGQAERERVERMAQYGRSRNDSQPVSAGDMEVLRRNAAANAEVLKQIGESKAAWKEQEAKDKAENLRQQAEELEEQLVNDRPYKSRTVKLNPVGTNLYTRNYSSARPPVKALEAQTQTLPDPAAVLHARGLVQSGNVNAKKAPGAVPRGKGNSAGRTETKVNGEVLPRN